MKRLLLATLLAFAGFASAQTATLSTGASCAYSSVAVGPGGNIAVACHGAAPPVVVPPIVVPPVVVPVPPAPPAACGRDIPFARYLADACDLLCVQTWRGWGGLTDCEFEAAYKAGYPRPPGRPPSTGGLGFPPGFNLTDRVGAGVRNPLGAGQSPPFTFTARRTARAYWTIEINPGETSATDGTVNGRRLQPFVGWWREDFDAIAGQTARLDLWFNGSATVAVAVQYAE